MAVTVKVACLVVLTLMTSLTVLTMRYSRATTHQEPYLASTAVFFTEIIKIIVSVVSLFIDCGCSIAGVYNVLSDSLRNNFKETIKVIIPSSLYALQNNLLYIALTNLDAATYQVSYQLKILTTAVFSVLILKKTLRFQQWVALILLMAGAVLVQLPSGSEATNDTQSGTSRLVGFVAVLIASISSGFAGVYFEMLVKIGSSQTTSLPLRNLQLGVFAAFFAGMGMFYSDHVAIREKGILQGYNNITWVVIFLQAFGGLIISITIKYADNILKGFASSVSIIVSTLCSYYLLDDLAPSTQFMLGASIVISATFLYGLPQEKPKAQLMLSEIFSLPTGPLCRSMPRLNIFPKSKNKRKEESASDRTLTDV